MKVAVISLRFGPGHIAHLRAYRELFKSLGCSVRLFLDPEYELFFSESSEIEYTDSIERILSWIPDTVIAYNIATANVSLSKRCKRKGIPFFYVLHEPWDSLKELISLRQRAPRRIAANVVNYLTAHYAYKVILASENGKNKYLQYMKYCNSNYAVFPLIFCDDYDESLQVERKYFSFIGGFTVMRGCNEFLNYIKYSIEKHNDALFCIATRSVVNINDSLLQEAMQNGTLSVFAGKPMTSDEINTFYRQSICSWNAYKSSTQSGVLPNALMQGSPVLVSNRNDTRGIIRDKKDGCYIPLPHKNEDIEQAFDYIRIHLDEMSIAARETFHKDYDYNMYLHKASSVYEVK